MGHEVSLGASIRAAEANNSRRWHFYSTGENLFRLWRNSGEPGSFLRFPPTTPNWRFLQNPKNNLQWILHHATIIKKIPLPITIIILGSGVERDIFNSATAIGILFSRRSWNLELYLQFS